MSQNDYGHLRIVRGFILINLLIERRWNPIDTHQLNFVSIKVPVF